MPNKPEQSLEISVHLTELIYTASSNKPIWETSASQMSEADIK